MDIFNIAILQSHKLKGSNISKDIQVQSWVCRRNGTKI